MKKLLALGGLCFMGLSGYSITIPPLESTAIFKSCHRERGMLIELYRTLEPKILLSSDESEIKSYLEPYNPMIINYVKDRYDENLGDYFDLDDPAIFLSGLLIAHFEVYE